MILSSLVYSVWNFDAFPCPYTFELSFMVGSFFYMGIFVLTWVVNRQFNLFLVETLILALTLFFFFNYILKLYLFVASSA